MKGAIYSGEFPLPSSSTTRRWLFAAGPGRSIRSGGGGGGGGGGPGEGAADTCQRSILPPSQTVRIVDFPSLWRRAQGQDVAATVGRPKQLGDAAQQGEEDLEKRDPALLPFPVFWAIGPVTDEGGSAESLGPFAEMVEVLPANQARLAVPVDSRSADPWQCAYRGSLRRLSWGSGRDSTECAGRHARSHRT